MDLSALIFVALAVAWATYLIPKALRHHEDSSTSRSVEGFSGRLRVLARREPVDSKSARLVVGPGKPTSTAKPVQPAKPAQPPAVPAAARRAAAARAAKRRLRVVLTIVVVGVAVGVAAALGYVATTWLAAPAAVLVAWLVACRLMVKRERAVVVPTRRVPVADENADETDPVTEEILKIEAEVEISVPAEPAVASVEPEPEPEPASAGWDPVPTTLPTYVGKEPAARRSVRTIDLDSTGVWTSGRTAADSALAREADAERARTSRAEDEKKRRASGS